MKWYAKYYLVSSINFIVSWWSDKSSIIQFHLWILLCLDEVICQVLFDFVHDFNYVFMRWYVKYYSVSSMNFIMSWWSDTSSIIRFHLWILWVLLCIHEVIHQVLFGFIYEFYYVLMKWYVKYYLVSSMHFIISRWSDMSSIIRFHLWILLCLDEVICQVLFGFIYEFYYVLMKWYVKYYTVSSMNFIMSWWSDMLSIIRFPLWILLYLDEVICQVLFVFSSMNFVMLPFYQH
jgi:hypothetical protein